MMQNMQPVTSSNIESIGFDQDKDLLYIEFKNGNTYVYDNVPFDMYTALMDADSVGSFFHKHIRTTYAYSKI